MLKSKRRLKKTTNSYTEKYSPDGLRTKEYISNLVTQYILMLFIFFRQKFYQRNKYLSIHYKNKVKYYDC